MRIPVLLLVRELDIGGCERDLTRTAIALRDSDYVPLVGCFHDQGMRRADLDEAGVEVIRFAVTSFASMSLVGELARFRRLVRQRGIRLVHAFDVPTSIFLGLASPLLPGVKKLSAQLSHRDMYLPREQRLMNLSDRLVDQVVVNSRAVGWHLMEHFHTPAAKLRLCYNGLDPRFTSGPRPALPEVAGAGTVVGTICALRPEKQVGLLVDAFAEVAPRFPDSKLLIVGSGPEKPALEQMVQRLGLAQRCAFVPSTRDVLTWLRALDVFVSTSDTESFSNSLLEAMGAGRAVISTAVGGNAEMVRDGESGLLIPRGDKVALVQALERMLAEPGLRARLAAAAAVRAHEVFSLSNNISHTQAIYRTALAGVRPQPELLFVPGEKRESQPHVG